MTEKTNPALYDNR